MMPAYCRGANSLGTKLVTLYPDNEKKGLASHLGIVLLFDASTGQLQAVSTITMARINSTRTPLGPAGDTHCTMWCYCMLSDYFIQCI